MLGSCCEGAEGGEGASRSSCNFATLEDTIAANSQYVTHENSWITMPAAPRGLTIAINEPGTFADKVNLHLLHL
jgi:hypothetical protein